MIAITGTLGASTPPSTDTRVESAARRAEFQAALQRAAAVDPSRLRGVDGALMVRPQRTPLSGQQAADAISSAWTKATGETPSKATVSILTAHWAHETGRGDAMYNFNFAGIKGASPEGLSASYRTKEGWGPHEHRRVDHFRAYSSAEAGADDYLKLLATRYPDAVKAAQNEDPAGFVTALKDKGYFTGDQTAYLRNVTRLANEAMSGGFDAVGGTSGALAQAVLPENQYFSMQESASASGASPDFSRLGTGAQPSFGGLSAYSFVDEINRAALRLVVDSGSSND